MAPVSLTVHRTPAKTSHQRITEAGWRYRTNDHGWLIYRNPLTGLWHTREEAVNMLDQASAPPIADTNRQ
jgi:hypothetical protein